jgi:hypothetical protein
VLHESARLYEASQETLDKTDAENCSDLLRVQLLRGRSLIERDHLANFPRATQPGLAPTGKANRMRMKIIQVKPARGYAKTRQGFGRGEVRVVNSAGEILEVIRFDYSGKKL